MQLGVHIDVSSIHNGHRCVCVRVCVFVICVRGGFLHPDTVVVSDGEN